MNDCLPIKDSGEREVFQTGAQREKKRGLGAFTLIPWKIIWDLSKYFEAGAEQKGARNWEKGIPVSSYLNSTLRHLARYMAGERDENHLMAAVWNLVCCLWTKWQIACGNLPADLDDIEADLVKQQIKEGRP
jgi:hypothetical protein